MFVIWYCVTRTLKPVCASGSIFKKLNELTAYVNIELQKIANWLRANKMAINKNKTKFIVFRTRGKRVEPDDCQLVYNDNEIGTIEDPNLIYLITCVFNEGDEKNFKLLGILFDEFLSFDDHITSICSKISKSLFCLNRIKNFVTNSAKIPLLCHGTLPHCLLYQHIWMCNTNCIEQACYQAIGSYQNCMSSRLS